MVTALNVGGKKQAALRATWLSGCAQDPFPSTVCALGTGREQLDDLPPTFLTIQT